MIKDEIRIGSVRRLPYACLAYTAAHRIAQEDGKLVAVGIDPSGEVYLDLPDAIAEVDAIGYYRSGIPSEIQEIIYGDLKQEAKERGLRR